VVAVEHDHPGTRAEDGAAAAYEIGERRSEALALDPERHGRRLAAWDHESVKAVEVRRNAHESSLCSQVGERAGVRLEVALER
jgi:hypothetical protein